MDVKPKKKVFWVINQLFKIGGVEYISLFLANLLKDDFDITIVLLSDDEINEEYFHVDEKIKVVKLNISPYIIRNEDFRVRKTTDEFFKTSFQTLSFFLFNRFKYRRILRKMTSEDDVIISNSIFSFMIAPRKRTNIFHYHFNSRYLNQHLNKFIFKHFCIKPKKRVYLSLETLNKLKRSQMDKKRSTFIYNPSRIERNYDPTLHNNTFYFVARYEYQKDPMLALRSIRYLSEKHSDFHAIFAGGGYYYEQMKDYIVENNLSSFITLYDHPLPIEEVALEGDFLLMTSHFEGFPLTVIESNCMGKTCVSVNFGDSTKETIVNGETGIVVNSRDPKKIAEALYSLLTDKEKLVKMKENAYKYSERYDKETIRKEWIDLIYGKKK